MPNQKTRLTIPGMAEATDAFFEMRMALAIYYNRLAQAAPLIAAEVPSERYDRDIADDVRKGLAHIQTVCEDLARFVEPLGG